LEQGFYCAGLMDVQKVGDTVSMEMIENNVRLRIDDEALLSLTVNLDDRLQLGEFSGFCGDFDFDPTDEFIYANDQSALDIWVHKPVSITKDSSYMLFGI
jgi:hypothetical protein